MSPHPRPRLLRQYTPVITSYSIHYTKLYDFEGNVVIDVENGHIESDVADMEFNGYQLRTATIVGSPATFEMQRPGSEDKTYAEAGKLVYDFSSSVVEFSDDATIRITSYNVCYTKLLRLYAQARLGQ